MTYGPPLRPFSPRRCARSPVVAVSVAAKRLQIVGLAAAAWFATMSGVSALPPLPPARPPELSGVSPATPEPENPATPQASAGHAAIEDVPPPGATSCRATLARLGLETETAASTETAGAACRIDDPVRLLGLRVTRGPAIVFADRPVVACRLAAALGPWLGGVASPVLSGALGAPPVAIRTGPGYECRSRNHVAGAKMSAHALGLAIDVASFDLADKRNVAVATSAAWEPAFGTLRIAACGWFTTVLGPGSDGYHAGHLHLDVQQHGSSDRYRICQ